MTKLLLTVCMLLGVTSCFQKSAAPMLGEIYNRAAMQSHVDRNPIIVIPGVLGSRLIEDGSGKVVWGKFGSGAISYRNAGDLRTLAVPMSDRGWPRDNVKPDGTLSELQVAWGFDFRFKAYSQMLEAFGVGGYLDIAHGGVDGIDYGKEHFSCFQFSYDWRRSNAENAALLGKFIEDKRKYVAKERKRLYGSTQPVKFDIIAHSMGGLVARYHMMYGSAPLSNGGDMPVTWAGAKNVDKLILVGTPNKGSVNAFTNLKNGFKLSPILPRLPSAVVGTMPSSYELLPPESVDPLVDKDSNPIAYYDVEEWDRRGWGLLDPKQAPVLEKLLPDVTDPQARKAVAKGHLTKMLSNAKAFHRAINLSSTRPRGLRLYGFVGDAVETGSRAQILESGKAQLIDFVPGDGTVTRRSVLGDLRGVDEREQRLKSSINWSGVQFIFADHVGLTSNSAFVDNVLYLLLESNQ